jgi:hypothetical protein
MFLVIGDDDWTQFYSNFNTESSESKHVVKVNFSTHTEKARLLLHVCLIV